MKLVVNIITNTLNKLTANQNLEKKLWETRLPQASPVEILENLR